MRWSKPLLGIRFIDSSRPRPLQESPQPRKQPLHPRLRIFVSFLFSFPLPPLCDRCSRVVASQRVSEPQTRSVSGDSGCASCTTSSSASGKEDTGPSHYKGSGTKKPLGIFLNSHPDLYKIGVVWYLDPGVLRDEDPHQMELGVK